MTVTTEVLVAPLELRVGLTERECRAWIDHLRNGRKAKDVAGEMERAVDAALAAGITNRADPGE